MTGSGPPGTLPNHAVRARATPTISEAASDSIRAVFETLAPELPAGAARFRFAAEPYRLLEGADAAGYRCGAG